MRLKVFIVAAFTDQPFTGNPAGVCLLESELTGPDMQKVASELRQPETAFVHRCNDGWGVRWFSPVVEIDLCGHATLAAARVLWATGLADPLTPINFISSVATLSATPGYGGLNWLDFPALPGNAEPAPAAILTAVGGYPTTTARHADRWLLEYGTADEVRAVSPDFDALRATGVRSLIVTALSDRPEYNIISRNFAPIVGVDEDQVTGMAHTCLAPHWRDRLGSTLRCWQASRRGGELLTRLSGDRVQLGGRAVIEFQGELYV